MVKLPNSGGIGPTSRLLLLSSNNSSIVSLPISGGIVPVTMLCRSDSSRTRGGLPLTTTPGHFPIGVSVVQPDAARGPNASRDRISTLQSSTRPGVTSGCATATPFEHVAGSMGANERILTTGPLRTSSSMTNWATNRTSLPSRFMMKITRGQGKDLLCVSCRAAIIEPSGDHVAAVVPMGGPKRRRPLPSGRTTYTPRSDASRSSVPSGDHAPRSPGNRPATPAGQCRRNGPCTARRQTRTPPVRRPETTWAES